MPAAACDRVETKPKTKSTDSARRRIEGNALLPHHVSTFALAGRTAILRRVKTPKPSPTPKWKETILTSSDWPEDFAFPQMDFLPEGAESVLESMYGNEHWEWELWRQLDGQRYFLKIWPFNDGKFSDPNTPGVALTVPEAFQFLMTNWMPQIVLEDFTAQCPAFLKDLATNATPPSLN